jgi:hypothetical protein
VEEDILPVFDLATLQFDPKERYQDFRYFATPTRQPVFHTLVHRFHVGRRAMVVLAGASISGKIPPKPDPGQLLIRACLVQDSGDGVIGRVTLSIPGRQWVVLEHEFVPQHHQGDGTWLEKRIDLGDFRGLSPEVRIQCFNPWSREVVADWVAWSIRRTLPE